MFEGCDGRVCDAWSLQSSNCLLPSFVCCLSCLQNIQLCRGLTFVIKGAETSGGGCFDDCRKANLLEVLWWKACPAQTASWIIAWMRGLAAMRAPRCAGAAMSRALMYQIPDWPALSVACVILSSVRPGKSRSRDRCQTSS